jgi:hypothetical protein
MITLAIVFFASSFTEETSGDYKIGRSKNANRMCDRKSEILLMFKVILSKNKVQALAPNLGH